MDQLSEGLRKLILAGIGAVAATKEKSVVSEVVAAGPGTPEETCGEENDEEESADDTADFVMDAVDSLNDEQLERRSQSGR